MSEQATSSAPRGQRRLEDAGFFGRIADEIVRDLRPASVLDAGCGSGLLVEALRQRGVDAHGPIESPSEPIDGRYDLVVCIDALERMTPAESDLAIANLCAASDRLLLSTPAEDVAEPAAVEAAPAAASVATLAGEGFVRDLDRDLSHVAPRAALYTRSEAPLPEAVHRYERSLNRARREAGGLRDDLDERAAGDPAAARPPDRHGDRAGHRQGPAAELEERPQRLLDVRREVVARIPLLRRLLGLVDSLLRRFR